MGRSTSNRKRAPFSSRDGRPLILPMTSISRPPRRSASSPRVAFPHAMRRNRSPCKWPRSTKRPSRCRTHACAEPEAAEREHEHRGHRDEEPQRRSRRTTAARIAFHFRHARTKQHDASPRPPPEAQGTPSRTSAPQPRQSGNTACRCNRSHPTQIRTTMPASALRRFRPAAGRCKHQRADDTNPPGTCSARREPLKPSRSIMRR